MQEELDRRREEMERLAIEAKEREEARLKEEEEKREREMEALREQIARDRDEENRQTEQQRNAELQKQLSVSDQSHPIPKNTCDGFGDQWDKGYWDTNTRNRESFSESDFETESNFDFRSATLRAIDELSENSESENSDSFESSSSDSNSTGTELSIDLKELSGTESENDENKENFNASCSDGNILEKDSARKSRENLQNFQDYQRSLSSSQTSLQFHKSDSEDFHQNINGQKPIEDKDIEKSKIDSTNSQKDSISVEPEHSHVTKFSPDPFGCCFGGLRGRLGNSGRAKKLGFLLSFLLIQDSKHTKAWSGSTGSFQSSDSSYGIDTRGTQERFIPVFFNAPRG